jgi:hypothetical protein
MMLSTYMRGKEIVELVQRKVPDAFSNTELGHIHSTMYPAVIASGKARLPYTTSSTSFQPPVRLWLLIRCEASRMVTMTSATAPMVAMTWWLHRKL